jgi:myosin heavy subunit
MWYDRVLELLKNRYAQLAAAVLAGALLTALLYPSSQTTESIKQEYQTLMDKKVQEQKDITSSVTKSLDEMSQNFKTLNDQYTSKVSELNQTISQMSSHKTEIHYKITKPDGTIEERSYFESEDTASTQMISEMKSDYERKLQQTESDLQQKHDQELTQIKSTYSLQVAELNQTISKLEKDKTVIVNPKKWGFELGATADMTAYLHTSYVFWGPLFIGSHYEIDRNKKTNVGAGLGITL